VTRIEFTQHQQKTDKDGNPKGLDAAVRKYNRAVRALDEGVGRLLAALREHGQLDRTAVVFTSDQGFAWGQHGFKWKYAPYDANLRAPLLIRYPPRVPAGTVCEHPVGGHDLIPTFFSLARIDLPWKMHGRDIGRLLADPRAEWDQPVMLENTRWYYGSDTDRGSGDGWGGVPWWIFLRQGKYKYIRTLVEGEIEELYDLEADPDELVNLALDPRYASVLRDYRQRLLDELKRTDAGMVKNLPRVAQPDD
jgi:arylsulfatase A-like enzyme